MEAARSPRCGLDQSTIARIQMVFAQFPQIGEVRLYGSRAKGDFQRGSDIDLTIIGAGLDHRQLLTIETALDDLARPYLIDLSLFDRIVNVDQIGLIDLIARIGKVFYRAAVR